MLYVLQYKVFQLAYQTVFNRRLDAVSAYPQT